MSCKILLVPTLNVEVLEKTNTEPPEIDYETAIGNLRSLDSTFRMQFAQNYVGLKENRRALAILSKTASVSSEFYECFDAYINELMDSIKGPINEIYAEGSIPIVVSGDHTPSAGVVRYCKDFHKHLGLIVLDAHNDRKEKKYWDSSWFARHLTHNKWLCPLFGYQPYTKVIDEKNYMLFGLTHALTKPWKNEFRHTKEDAFFNKLDKIPKKVYLSIDLDVIEGYGIIKDGLLDKNTFLRCLDRILEVKTIVGIDIMEFSGVETKLVCDIIKKITSLDG